MIEADKMTVQEREELTREIERGEHEDKQRALNMLTYALSYTRAGADVGSINIMDNGDTARVYTADGVIDVNIALDSAIAAIIDVCKALM